MESAPRRMLCHEPASARGGRKAELSDRPAIHRRTQAAGATQATQDILGDAMNEIKLWRGKAMKVNSSGMYSLTDLWKASGGKVTTHPYRWQKMAQSKAFIGEVSKTTRNHAVILAVRGKGLEQGTWAHWQIALAYAKYLSPKLHMRVNEVFQQYMEAAPELAESVIDRNDNPDDLARIEARARAKVVTKALGSTINRHNGQPKTYAMVNGLNNKTIFGKKTSEVRKELGLKPYQTTREHLSTEGMAVMSFLEAMEARGIEKRKAKGHDAIIRTVSEVNQKVTQLVAQYA